MRRPKERLRQADNAVPRGLLPRTQNGAEMVENGSGGPGVHGIQRITSSGTNSLFHTQSMELLRALFSITLAKCHFIGPTSQELWVGVLFCFSSHKCLLKVMAGFPCNITIFTYSKIFIGWSLCTRHHWKRSHLPPPINPIHGDHSTSHFPIKF